VPDVNDPVSDSPDESQQSAMPIPVIEQEEEFISIPPPQ